MRIKRLIRKFVISKLPNNIQNKLDRVYFYHFVSDYIKEDVKIIKLLCQKNKVSLDVGANQGIISIYLSKYSSRVICFEPVFSLAENLREKFRGSNVDVIECGLGNQNGRNVIYIPIIENEKKSTRSSLLNNFENVLIDGEKITDIEKQYVEIKKLDDFKIENIGFIKIDVEGYEYEVLKGGRATVLNNMPNIYIEIEQRHHLETDIKEIFNYILDMGYKGYFIKDGLLEEIWKYDNKTMQNVNEEKSKNYINNFIFTKNRLDFSQIAPAKPKA